MKINDVEFNADLEEILTELTHELELNGIQLLQKMKQSGADIMVQCPYHGDGQERRPSAGIRKSDGIFHCFACNETHTLPEVISHCFGKDAFGEFGWRWLLQNFGTVSVEERKDLNLLMDRQNDVIKRDDEQIEYVSEEELDSYRYFHPYMYERGLTDDVIDMFDIGFDRDSKCITFPVRDIRGNCLFVARRSVSYKFFNYPKGVEKPLYGLYELFREKSLYESSFFRNRKISPATFDRLKTLTQNGCSELIVCESMLDALSFWTVGKYAVALNGLGNELQFKQLRDLPCRKLILATDMDDRGLSARDRIRKNVPNKIITQYFFPEGRKDANDCTKEELRNLVDVF